MTAKADIHLQLLRILGKAERIESRWTQSALLLRWSDTDRFVVFESTLKAHALPLGETTERSGVQRTWLDEKLERYPGFVAVRRLSKRLTQAMEERLLKYAETVDRRAFGTLTPSVIRAMGEKRRIPFDASSYLCSQLVASAFDEIGLLVETQATGAYGVASYSPTDFSSQRRNRVLLGYDLGVEIYLKGDEHEHMEFARSAHPRGRRIRRS